MRTSKATLDNYPTNKVDPTTGPTRRENRDRNPVGKTEIPPTTSSISKPNGSEHSKLTKEKEQTYPFEGAGVRGSRFFLSWIDSPGWPR
jgi:hypothetical protein